MNLNAPIRSARLADLPGLLALETGFESDRISPRSMRRLLQRPSAQIRVIDDETNPDRLLAAAILLTRHGSRVARLYSIIVKREARGRGLAHALVDDALSLARLTGCSRMNLEVAADNVAAIALYRRHGFDIGDVLPGYYADGGDGVRMFIVLTSLAS